MAIVSGFHRLTRMPDAEAEAEMLVGSPAS